MTTQTKKFYHFHQNNSGGSFDIDPTHGIGENVWIEADDDTQANTIAECIGLYWNGCESGQDCPCCGDRWYPCQESDGKDAPDTEGYYTQEAYVHYADERIEKITRTQGDAK